MAYDDSGIASISSGFSNIVSGALWTYKSPTDDLATIQTAGYFDPLVSRISLSEVIQATDSTGAVTLLEITTINPTAPRIVTSNLVTASIPDGSITTVKLANLLITTAKIAALAVTTAKIANDAVTTIQLANNAVSPVKIQNDAVTGPKIPNDSITFRKLEPQIQPVLNPVLQTEVITNDQIVEQFDIGTVIPIFDSDFPVVTMLIQDPGVIAPGPQILEAKIIFGVPRHLLEVKFTITPSFASVLQVIVFRPVF